MPRRATGFTLLELLVVVAIVAIASAGVAFSLQDASRTRLDREAQRLAALLESGRAQSRASGVPMRWRSTPNGFVFEGMPAGTPRLPSAWEHTETQAHSNAPLVLGPEPLIGAQQVRLWLQEQPARSLWVVTDGIRPFAVQNTAP
ncbi:pilus assembly FimT family protein [Rhodoferax sp.]|uniref:pilus assembly FimT family protein n=1 Tax=Rhodoferax sp. TaxID=50421 RepID=UPI002ACEF03D|nr:prepilin-type N-terminal cleavage/methylation domain-containing protein [Rhodoferax sp.]MDZ7920358.1 prepilin-type N-terminal cleavage/methylation domain-containing protein [Rhodoferax sp.]